MEITEIDSLLSTPEELIKKVSATKGADNTLKYQKQYDPKQHDVTDKGKRPDKIIESDQAMSTTNVARLPVPLQKKIVALAAAFLCGNPVELSASPVDQREKDMLAVLKRSWKDNKLDYESKRLAKLMMSETEVAEIWYLENIEPGYWKGTANDQTSVKLRLRTKIIANKYGDKLYPVFNNQGDMIAFGRGYTLKIGEKNEEHFDLYTDTKVHKMTKLDSWVNVPEANPFQKIPVIYFSQEAPEWHDVQEMIDRFETLISNHADTNDYFGSPMVIVSGEIEGFAKKGESGKVLQLKNGAKAEYLSWPYAPESVKLEYQNLRSLIFDLTDTPDISIEQMKALGTYSGIALKMLFLGAHLKAADKEETFGKGIQRRINLMKSALGNVINIKLTNAVPMLIEPKFEYYLPKNHQEMIEMLSTATNGGATMSQQTAVENNPFVKDPATELERIKEAGLNSETEE